MRECVPVWCYWVGKMWPHIAVCLDSIKRCCRESAFKLVTDDTFMDYVYRDRVHPDWRKIPEPGVRSDIIRAALLAEHGGVYLDADTICLRDPVLLATDCDLRYARWSTPPDRVIAGYVSARPGSQIASKWLANINETVEKRGAENIGWLDIGEGCLTPVVNATPGYYHDEMLLSTVLPIEIDREVGLFFTTMDWRAFVRPSTVCFGLNHSWFVSRRPKDFEDPEKWKDSPMLIHKLLTDSMAKGDGNGG